MKRSKHPIRLSDKIRKNREMKAIFDEAQIRLDSLRREFESHFSNMKTGLRYGDREAMRRFYPVLDSVTAEHTALASHIRTLKKWLTNRKRSGLAPCLPELDLPRKARR